MRLAGLQRDRRRGNETGLLHHAGSPDAPELGRDAEGGSRGHHPRRQARLLRCLHGRAPDRRLRDHHQQHDVPRHADPGDQADQTRDRHVEPLPYAPGADRGAGRDVRPPVRGPFHSWGEPRRAHHRRGGARHPGPGSQQDVRGVDRRDPRHLGARSALRHRLPRQPLQGLDRAHDDARSRGRHHGQALPEAAPGDRRHGGSAVLAGRSADGQARLSSALRQLSAVEAPEVALAELLQGQGGGWRGSERCGLAGGAGDLRSRRRQDGGALRP